MKKYLAIIIAALMLAACNKGDDKPYIPLNTQLKNSYSFKEGSYWIYKDSITGRRDSFFVDYYQYIKSVDQGGSNTEKINLVIKDYPIDTPLSDSSSWLFTLLNGETMALQYQHLISPNEFFIITYLNYGYPFVTGYNPDHSLYTLVYPSLLINNQSYTNVARLISGADSYYMRDSIGFVKINMHYQSIRVLWELQRYHINF